MLYLREWNAGRPLKPSLGLVRQLFPIRRDPCKSVAAFGVDFPISVICVNLRPNHSLLLQKRITLPLLANSRQRAVARNHDGFIRQDQHLLM